MQVEQIIEAVNWNDLDTYLNKIFYFQTVEFKAKVNEIIAEFQYRFKQLQITTENDA